MVKVYKASRKGNEIVPDLNIIANEESPGAAQDSINWEIEAKAFYRNQALKLYAALKESLPQGTMDNLFGYMALDRASILEIRS